MLGADYMADILGAPCVALKEFHIMDSWCELCEMREGGECWREYMLRAEENGLYRRTEI